MRKILAWFKQLTCEHGPWCVNYRFGIKWSFTCTKCGYEYPRDSGD